MDEQRFDSLTRVIGNSGSRRALFKSLLGLGAVTAGSALHGAEAARRGYSGPPILPTPSPAPTPTCTPACIGDNVCLAGVCVGHCDPQQPFGSCTNACQCVPFGGGACIAFQTLQPSCSTTGCGPGLQCDGADHCLYPC